MHLKIYLAALAVLIASRGQGLPGYARGWAEGGCYRVFHRVWELFNVD